MSRDEATTLEECVARLEAIQRRKSNGCGRSSVTPRARAADGGPAMANDPPNLTLDQLERIFDERMQELVASKHNKEMTDLEFNFRVEQLIQEEEQAIANLRRRLII